MLQLTRNRTTLITQTVQLMAKGKLLYLNIFTILNTHLFSRGLRSKSTIMRLNMYKGGKPVRTKEGKIIGGLYMSKDKVGFTILIYLTLCYYVKNFLSGWWERSS